MWLGPDTQTMLPGSQLFYLDQLLSCTGIFPQIGKVAPGGSGQQRFWLLALLEKEAPSDGPSTSRTEDSHWLSVGHMPISEPITLAEDERY